MSRGGAIGGMVSTAQHLALRVPSMNTLTDSAVDTNETSWTKPELIKAKGVAAGESAQRLAECLLLARCSFRFAGYLAKVQTQSSETPNSKGQVDLSVSNSAVASAALDHAAKHVTGTVRTKGTLLQLRTKSPEVGLCRDILAGRRDERKSRRLEIWAQLFHFGQKLIEIGLHLWRRMPVDWKGAL